MAQRLGLARALLHAPRLLLLDEPYAGLDAAGAKPAGRRAGQLGPGRGAVMVTHEVERGVALAGRVMVLRAGRPVLQEGPPRDSAGPSAAATRSWWREPRGRPSAARQLRALLLKDLRLELRTRDTIVAMVLFAVVAMLIFQFAFGARGDDLSAISGGIMWATLALTAVLGVGRSWVPEREQRVLDGILVAPIPAPGAAGGQGGRDLRLPAGRRGGRRCPSRRSSSCSHPEPVDFVLIMVVCLLANLGISILGSLLACLALFARARELLLPVLFLPSLLPVVIAAAGATHAVSAGTNDLAEYRGYCVFLGVYAVIFGLVAYATYEHVFDD